MKGIEIAESAQEQIQNKLWITCTTCGISKAFYTPHGVRYFELTHLNHEIRRGRVETENIQVVEEEPMPERLGDAVEDEQPVELPTVVLKKLVVSLAISGSEKKQSIRVRGEGPEEKDMFVLNFPVESVSEVKALIEGGEHIEDVMPPMGRFTWTPQLLEASDQVAVLLGLTKPVSEPEPARVETPQVPVELKNVEVIPEPEVKAEPVKVIQRREAKKETPLLLAKSSYIQENEENRNEATRISKVLMEFRWNIEPPYGINVLFDDNMSIQSNTGAISSNLIGKIEELGYAFVAFEASKGVPTAWFKKKRNEDSSQLTLFPDFGEVILPNPLGKVNGFPSLTGELGS